MKDPFLFKVPKNKQVKVIIDTDAKNEADDQYAITHALMSPKLKVQGIVATHFSKRRTTESMMESYLESKKIVDIMGVKDVPVWRGNIEEIQSETEAEVSEGVKFIADTILNNEEDIYILCMGALTNIAAAMIYKPELADKMHIIWVGGRKPNEANDGREANARNDIKAVNLVMKTCKYITHIPMECYAKMSVSLAELQLKVKSCGEIGEYLFHELMEFNYEVNRPWSLGESWGLGDNSAVSVILNPNNSTVKKRKAFLMDEEMNIIKELDKDIDMIDDIDSRYVLEDFFAKLEIKFK